MICRLLPVLSRPKGPAPGGDSHMAATGGGRGTVDFGDPRPPTPSRGGVSHSSQGANRLTPGAGAWFRSQCVLRGKGEESDPVEEQEGLRQARETNPFVCAA